jgi:hypothetical protein
LLVALAVGVLATGCGIPSSTDVRVDGPMVPAGAPAAGDGAASPPGPDDAGDEVELVENFLQAAAGDLGDPVRQLAGFVRSDQRDRWRPDPRIVVVRPVGQPFPTPGRDEVRVQLDVLELGVLGADGVIEPMAGARRRPLEFEVVVEQTVTTNEGAGVSLGNPALRIVDPPEEVMLSTQALEAGYLLPRPVYFWDGQGEELVPDLRWLPSALADGQRAQRVLDWLAEGPAPWLDGAVTRLPDDVALDGNVVWSEDGLEVGLTAAADLDPARLDAQLWWTLRPELADGDRALVLRIDGQTRTVADYPFANPAVGEPPAGFAVVDGVIRQYRPDAPEVDLPALAEESNAGVHSAALTRDGRLAALVKTQGDGLFRLELTRPGGRTATSLRGAVEMSRPLWLTSGQVGLVAADGDLYRFQAGDERVDDVPVPGELGEITAVAAAPDGHRLALVAGGRLYTASMTWREDGLVTVNEPRLLKTTATALKGVGFLREDWLTVVGQEPEPDGGQLRLYEITVDGADERQLHLGELGTPSEVSNLVAYPGDPSDPRMRGLVMYESDEQAYVYTHPTPPVPIDGSDLIGAGEDAADPRAPFFLD